MSIKSLAEDDRPREKFLLKGKDAVSDSELLAIIMGSGNRKESAVELARRILKTSGNSWSRLAKYTIKDLMKFPGFGEAKAIAIAAALEIGRRKSAQEIPENQKIENAENVFLILSPHLSDLSIEEFWAIFLNQNNQVIYKTVLTKGGISESIVDVRILFKIALEYFATGIIVAHNHPSGNLTPSKADLTLTQKIKEAGLLLNIKLLDHLIITQKKYYSFADNGIL